MIQDPDFLTQLWREGIMLQSDLEYGRCNSAVDNLHGREDRVKHRSAVMPIQRGLESTCAKMRRMK